MVKDKNEDVEMCSLDGLPMFPPAAYIPKGSDRWYATGPLVGLDVTLKKKDVVGVVRFTLHPDDNDGQPLWRIVSDDGTFEDLSGEALVARAATLDDAEHLAKTLLGWVPGKDDLAAALQQRKADAAAAEKKKLAEEAAKAKKKLAEEREAAAAEKKKKKDEEKEAAKEAEKKKKIKVAKVSSSSSESSPPSNSRPQRVVKYAAIHKLTRNERRAAKKKREAAAKVTPTTKPVLAVPRLLNLPRKLQKRSLNLPGPLQGTEGPKQKRRCSGGVNYKE